LRTMDGLKDSFFTNGRTARMVEGAENVAGNGDDGGSGTDDDGGKSVERRADGPRIDIGEVKSKCCGG
jgi:hypothetical protein